MRIKLKKGCQKELIYSAKKDKTWKNLSSELNICEGYLVNELRYEKRLLSEEIYKKLCILANQDFDDKILKKLNNHWGMSMGGLNSHGSTISIKIPSNNEKLAEVIGIILGDGNICSINFSNNKKYIGVYQIKIAGDYNLDRNYHLDYIRPLTKELFNLEAKEQIVKNNRARFLFLSSKQLIDFLAKFNLISGNKIKNQLDIPNWIKNNNNFLKACLRGLIDTDGSIFKMSKKDPNLLRISFTNCNLTLLNSVRDSFEKLGFNPSKIISNKQIFLSSKFDIEKYLNEIGFSNKKHIDRLYKFRASPVV